MPLFEVFEDEADLDEIYIRLKDQDAMVRRIAVLDLAEMAEASSVAALIDCLSDSSADVDRKSVV